MNKLILSGLVVVSSFSLFGCQSTQPSSEVDDETIAKWLRDSGIFSAQQASAQLETINYEHGSADLNSDGHLEHFVLIRHRSFCGSGGCSAVIFDHSGKVINRLTLVKKPVLLTDSYQNGWQDFIVWSNGAYRSMRFNGTSYPSNPSVEPTVDRESQRKAALFGVTSTELYQQDGYGIKPIKNEVLWAPAEVYHFSFRHYGDPKNIYFATVDVRSEGLEIQALPLQP